MLHYPLRVIPYFIGITDIYVLICDEEEKNFFHKVEKTYHWIFITIMIE